MRKKETLHKAISFMLKLWDACLKDCHPTTRVQCSFLGLSLDSRSTCARPKVITRYEGMHKYFHYVRTDPQEWLSAPHVIHRYRRNWKSR